MDLNIQQTTLGMIDMEAKRRNTQIAIHGSTKVTTESMAHGSGFAPPIIPKEGQILVSF